MDYQLTPEWRIRLEQDYKRRLEDDQLVLWITGRTILAVVFRFAQHAQHTHPDKRDELLQKLKTRAEQNKMDIFESQSGDLMRFATLEPEDIGGGHLRLALHAFTAAVGTCLQTAFYFDKPADLQWAIQAWEAIQYFPQRVKENNQ